MTAFAFIQEGGTSDELYLHVHDTLEEAETHRQSCAEASYRTTEPVELPDNTDWDAMDTLLQSVPTLDFPDEPDDGVSGQDRESYADEQDRESYADEQMKDNGCDKSFCQPMGDDHRLCHN